MTSTLLELSCHDPIVARDGRPFGGGQNRMHAVAWPFPSVVAGSVRTALGKADPDRTFDDGTTPAELLRVAVAGLFPVVEERLYLPAPHDCVVHPTEGPLRAVPYPLGEGEGCDWPADGLSPVVLPADEANDEFKPKDGPAFWPIERLADWLLGGAVVFNTDFLSAPLRETREHVQSDAATGAVEESRLFTTAALTLTPLPRYGAKADAPFRERFSDITLITRVEADGWAGVRAAALNTWHPLGGKRRLAHWRAVPGGKWVPPPVLRGALEGASQVRMVLATPAIFSGGWRPGWLGEGLEGTPPAGGPTLRLVGVCTQRWRAVSGWSLAAPRGPKPVKRLVPAGGVYFFEVLRGSAAELAGGWLRSVCDDEQDRRDGFGVAVWGTW
jgi:CRISPR-associated protein Cmr3